MKNKVNRLVLGLLLLGLASVARAADSIPDFTAQTTAATNLITGILVTVAATAAFFVGLRIYKWIGKK